MPRAKTGTSVFGDPVVMGEPLLRNAPNFRALSGLPVADGRRLRDGVLYRSGAFYDLDEPDLAQFASYGIRTVIDLRGASERTAQPNRYPLGAEPEVLSFDVAGALGEGTSNRYWQAMRDEPNRHGARRAMQHVYDHMPAAVHGGLGVCFDILSDAAATPAVIHCAVGKDRTGILCALLMRTLGATEATIMADYLMSDGRYPSARKQFYADRIRARLGDLKTAQEISDALTGVCPEYLEAAFASIARDWGSVDAFLASAGINSFRIDRLKAALLE